MRPLRLDVRRASLAVLAGALLSLACALPASAFERYRKHHFFPGPDVNARMGWQVAKLADIDGDGLNDIATGAPEGDGHGLNGSGKVLVFSGKTGRLIFTLEGTQVNGRMGSSVGDAGDVDLDGFTDIIVGAPLESNSGRTQRGAIYIFSGRDGHEMSHIYGENQDDQFGNSVAGVGDLDGDGRPDVAVGAPYYDQIGEDSGLVYVLSSRDFSTIYRFSGIGEGDAAGQSIVAIGDTDGDGFTELCVGAVHGRGLFTGALAGNLLVFSMGSGRRLLRIDGLAAGDQIGRVVGDAGDVDADGAPDMITGTPQASPNGEVFAGSAFVFSGRDGHLIHRFNGERTNVSFGNSADGVGDVNGDGFADVMAGSPHTNHTGTTNGTVYVYSGRDGSLLFSTDGYQDAFAYSGCGLGDIDGDGQPDFCVGSPDYNAPGGALIGSTTVFVSTSLRLKKLADPVRVGTSLEFEVRGAPADAGSRYAILAGRRGGAALTPFVFPVGPGTASTLDLQPQFSATTSTPGFIGVLDASSRARISTPVPNSSSLVGRRGFFQAVLVNRAGVEPRVKRIGNAVTVTFAP